MRLNFTQISICISAICFSMFMQGNTYGQGKKNKENVPGIALASSHAYSGDPVHVPAADRAQVQDSSRFGGTGGDRVLKTPFGTFNLSQTTGSVFRVSGDELRKTPGNNLSEALRGRVPGLRITRGTNTPGSDGGYSYILNGGTPFILIDGQPRGLQVDLREVKEVLVLSDATFNSLMGILGDNGLIYVVTKSGNTEKAVVEVNYQHGVNQPTRLPELLNAYEYATVINRAASNDGFGNIYSQEELDAWRNGAADPVLLPDVDHMDEFVKSSTPSNFASLGVFGGTDNTVYSAFVGYSDWKGLERVGRRINGRDITFRTKIRARLSDLISTHASVYGQFGENERPVIGADQMFQWITTTPANAFPLTFGDTTYIVNNQFKTNVLSELKAGGIRTDYDANMFFDFGFDFDFSESVPGLNYQTYLLLRTFNSQSLQANNTPGTYTLETLTDQNGDDSLALRVNTVEFRQLDVGRTSSGVARNFTYGGNLSYSGSFGSDKLNINLSHLLYYVPTRSSSQPDVRNLTFNLNASYAYRDKYILFANLNSSSSSKFIGDNRTRMFPSFGVAWVASEESFLEDSKVIDFLKFRGSFGQIGTEYTASTFLYLDTWAGGRNNSTLYTGIADTRQNEFGFRVSQIGNPDIDWVTYDQLFAGMDVRLLGRLSLALNYFNISINDQVIQAGTLFSDALGNDAYLPFINYTKRKSEGLNAALTYDAQRGDLKYYAGINVGYNKKTLKKVAEVQHPDTYRLTVGRPDDMIMGFESDGLFTAENIADALPQFGDVQVGDIRYVDQNGDNVIDVRDQVEIGNNSPRVNYGISLGASYRGFNLDVVGSGTAGYDIDLSDISYYRHSGLGTYYGSVNKDLPNGNANPRLSATVNDNNFRTSDYWLVKGNYFRISFAELGYSLPGSLISGIRVDNVKVFLRGSNLALFSKMKGLDPEDTRSGLFEYPMMRNFTLGASISF
ncbi:SusC/RagA family TonB-linked outer membrane protein [Fulvivirga sp. M361]|uniref:SusC/RagA family TonB-linked outer membrane protein n=1 Tax=Fulvivirga sp. M361 TaxID=2594266 RepID=UPI001179E445|nr:SusC/RagA family TonB-linked outer membrane protein [Fulvivirga sp. M361]TRX59154.1 SusC/RagA family TonB-linked outer membrane protein [Fulvivirga sp. M361]